MAIGATIHTASREQTGRVIQTDAKGLDMLDSDSDTALNSIYRVVEALGCAIPGRSGRSP